MTEVHNINSEALLKNILKFLNWHKTLFTFQYVFINEPIPQQK
jgi:hypothetical protein